MQQENTVSFSNGVKLKFEEVLNQESITIKRSWFNTEDKLVAYSSVAHYFNNKEEPWVLTLNGEKLYGVTEELINEYFSFLFNVEKQKAL